MTFDDTARFAFSSISSEVGFGKLKLYIEENDFTCSCEYLSFMAWIAKNDTYIENENLITCKYMNGDLKLTEVKNILHIAEHSCLYTLSLTILGVLFALMLICIVSGMIVRKYRWSIRYHLTKYSLKKKQYQLFLNKSHEFVYDAFVSYEMNDRNWIVQELILNLENKSSVIRASSTAAQPDAFGSKDELLNSSENRCLPNVDKTNEDKVTFSLCIHERDFELGNRIDENIVKAIQMSR